MHINNAHKEQTMKTRLLEANAPKKAANVSINSELLRQAKEHRINLSQTLEQGLVEKLRKKLQENWLQENKESIKQYNERIAGKGAFSDGIRKF
jgi:antitoxin CcdA